MKKYYLKLLLILIVCCFGMINLAKAASSSSTGFIAGPFAAVDGRLDQLKYNNAGDWMLIGNDNAKIVNVINYLNCTNFVMSSRAWAAICSGTNGSLYPIINGKYLTAKNCLSQVALYNRERYMLAYYDDISGICLDKPNSVVVMGQQFGPYEEIGQMMIDTKHWLFSYKETKDKMWYVVVDGSKYGPYYSINNLQTVAERWAVVYGNNFGNSSNNLVLDGRDLGTIDDDIEIIGNGLVKYSVQDNVYFNDGKKSYGPYSQESLDKIGGSEEYWHFAVLNGGKQKVYISGKEYGPYDVFGNYHKDAKFEYLCYLKAGKFYYQVNGKNYGPLDNVDDCSYAYDDKGAWLFPYKQGKSWYVQSNKNKYGPYTGVTSIKAGGGHTAFSFTKSGKNNLAIDGKAKTLSTQTIVMSGDGRALLKIEKAKIALSYDGVELFNCSDSLNCAMVTGAWCKGPNDWYVIYKDFGGQLYLATKK